MPFSLYNIHISLNINSETHNKSRMQRKLQELSWKSEAVGVGKSSIALGIRVRKSKRNKFTFSQTLVVNKWEMSSSALNSILKNSLKKIPVK